MKKARTMRDLETDPRVSFISDERGICPHGGDGIWVYLKEGYTNTHLECGTIHEYTIADCCQQLNENVTPIQ